MNDPKQEITQVVQDLTASSSPTVQRDTLRKYFHPDASFEHPLCRVVGSKGSRDREMLKVYQWYRIMSPILKLQVNSFDYEERNLVIYLNITQIFHIFLSPFRPAPTNLLVRLTLKQHPTSNLFYITSQTDYYQPEAVLTLIFPPLASLIVLFKSLATLGCMVWCVLFQWTLGWWVPEVEALGTEGEWGESVWMGLGEAGMEGEKLPRRVEEVQKERGR